MPNNSTLNKKVLFSLFSVFLLLIGLTTTLQLVGKRQEVRNRAAGEQVNLSFAPPSNPISVAPNTDFTVDVVAAPSNGAKVTGTTVIVNFPSYVSFVSVTPNTFFGFPNNTEMLSLGTYCTSTANCRTAATGVTCTNNRCANASYPANTTTQLRFDLGAACDITHMGCLNNTCSVLKGAASDTCTSTCTGSETNATQAQCYPQIGTGNLATIHFRSGNANGSGGTISFASTTQVAGLDSAGNEITTNIGTLGSAVPVTVTGGSSPTPTAVPTNTPTPTPTATPTSATLNFKVKFANFVTASNGNKITQIQATFKNHATGATVYGPVNVSLSSQSTGVYLGTVTNINPTITYDIYLKENTHLQRKFASVTLTSGVNSQDWSTNNSLQLLAGDANNDNRVDLSDFDLLATDYRNAATQATSKADFNYDGYVDLSDFDVLATNYRAVGD